MIFFDTNVAVTAATPNDPKHERCLDVLISAERRGGCFAAHSLAEIYSVLSGRPGVIRVPPLDAVKIVAHLKAHYTVITLTPAEYEATILSLASLGHSGGMVYDALLMACARKSKASRIYTLNVRHFRMIAPDLAARIVEP